MATTKSYTDLKNDWYMISLGAVINIENYVKEKNDNEYSSFKKQIEILENLKTARNELQKPHFNYAFVSNAFEIGHYNYVDIPTMIFLFRHIHGFRRIKDIITTWIKGDAIVLKLDSLGTIIHAQIKNEGISNSQLKKYLSQIHKIDYELIANHKKISQQMGVAAKWIINILWLIVLGIAFTLLVIGGFSTTTILKGIRRMRRVIGENEQRFRSLFENNPNAVFLKDLNGRISYANKAASVLTGYSSDDLKKMQLQQIIIPKHRPMVDDNFKNASKGSPTYAEVGCLSNDGRPFTIGLTNSPIYVNGKCTGVFGVAEDITTRIEQEKRIQNNLRDKEVLLSEIHHRVKNNLALISGLLDLQQQYSGNPELTGILTDARRRVHSMAKVHELLYHESSLSEIELKSYIYNLTHVISTTFFDKKGNIVFDIEAEPINLNMNKAIPLGLILNELITNAFKHSFEAGMKGTVFIKLTRIKDTITLTILTDGKRLPKNFNIEGHQTLGMTLIRLLSIQIDASLNVVLGKYDGFQVKFKADNS